MATSKVVMIKILKYPVRVAMHNGLPSFLLTAIWLLNRSLSTIVPGGKSNPGSKRSNSPLAINKNQTRNAYAVTNHLNISMIAAIVTWIYGARLENVPKRRHKVRGQNSFLFSDLIVKVALNNDFEPFAAITPNPWKNHSSVPCCEWLPEYRILNISETSANVHSCSILYCQLKYRSYRQLDNLFFW